MLKLIFVFVLGLITGGLFGVGAMCCFISAGRADRADKKTDKGGRNLMEWRKNQGFIITNQMMVGGTEIVLGVHENNPNSFVTWQCKSKDDYIWGHYFTNLLAAQKDFCRRTLDEIKAIEVMKKPKTNER